MNTVINFFFISFVLLFLFSSLVYSLDPEKEAKKASRIEALKKASGKLSKPKLKDLSPVLSGKKEELNSERAKRISDLRSSTSQFRLKTPVSKHLQKQVKTSLPKFAKINKPIKSETLRRFKTIKKK